MKNDHDDRSVDNEWAQLWSFLWRGAVGGAFGTAVLFIYRFFTFPYLLDDFLVAALISVGNGFFVGAFIWLLRRLFGKNFGVALRMIAGTLFSFCSIGVYLFLQGVLDGSIKPFIIDVVLVGLMLGVPAGAIAKGKPPNLETRSTAVV